MAGVQVQDVAVGLGSTSDTDAGTCTLPSPSSMGSLPSFCDQTEYAPVDAMREAIRGMETEVVDLVFNGSSALSSTPGRLADWLKVPLECATATGNLSAVERLLAAGVGTEPPSHGTRPGLLLHTAAGSGNAPVIEAILRDGAKVGEVDKDRHDRTALHVAAASGRDAAVRAIASRSEANLDAVDTRGWTPLHVAANAGHRGAVVFLLLKGANAELMTVREGDSPLHLAAANNHAGVIEDLLALGKASVGLCNNAGQTALHLAARLHQVAACIALLRGGATIGRVCSQGLSCLDVAAWHGHSGQLLQVLTAGESRSDRVRRCSMALYYAAKANKIDTIRDLVALGANIDTKRSGGNTNLHCTATRGANGATEALLMTGASLEIRNNEGATPLHRACSFSQSSTVQLLLRWGADETATTFENLTAYELVGSAVEEELLSPEEVLSKVQLDAVIRSMLVNAPADRVWRVRGWLVLLRCRWLKRVACALADKRELGPRPAAVRLSAASDSSDSRVSSSGPGKAPANKNKKRKGKAAGGGGGSSASGAKMVTAFGGKGKGQATSREKESGEDGDGDRDGGSKTQTASVSRSKGYSSGNRHGSGNGGGKRVEGQRHTERVNKLIQLWSSDGGGVARAGAGVAAAAAAAGSRVARRPELRLGRGSVLSEGGVKAAVEVTEATGGEADVEPKQEFVEAVERLLLLREEGVFREIVSFL
eukprot:g11884.t1